jgi:integrase
MMINQKRTEKNGAAIQLHRVFGLLFEHARRDLHWIEVNLARDIAKPKSKNKNGHHTLSDAEVEKLRTAHPDYASDERTFLEIGIAWGPRAGDLCQLGWKNIEHGLISFTPEKTRHSTGAEVTLPVTGEHVAAVLAQRSKTDTFFFQQPPKGSNQYNRDKLVALNPKPWDYSRARKMWKEMRERAGIGDEPTIHSMRKAFATRMANKGANPQDIADALGDTLASAMIYTKKRDKRAGAARAIQLVEVA